MPLGGLALIVGRPMGGLYGLDCELVALSHSVLLLPLKAAARDLMGQRLALGQDGALTSLDEVQLAAVSCYIYIELAVCLS
jgi:hypothetical protein